MVQEKRGDDKKLSISERRDGLDQLPRAEAILWGQDAAFGIYEELDYLRRRLPGRQGDVARDSRLSWVHAAPRGSLRAALAWAAAFPRVTEVPPLGARADSIGHVIHDDTVLRFVPQGRDGDPMAYPRLIAATARKQRRNITVPRDLRHHAAEMDLEDPELWWDVLTNLPKLHVNARWDLTDRQIRDLAYSEGEAAKFMEPNLVTILDSGERFLRLVDGRLAENHLRLWQTMARYTIEERTLERKGLRAGWGEEELRHRKEVMFERCVRETGADVRPMVISHLHDGRTPLLVETSAVVGGGFQWFGWSAEAPLSFEGPQGSGKSTFLKSIGDGGEVHSTFRRIEAISLAKELAAGGRETYLIDLDASAEDDEQYPVVGMHPRDERYRATEYEPSFRRVHLPVFPTERERLFGTRGAEYARKYVSTLMEANTIKERVEGGGGGGANVSGRSGVLLFEGACAQIGAIMARVESEWGHYVSRDIPEQGVGTPIAHRLTDDEKDKGYETELITAMQTESETDPNERQWHDLPEGNLPVIPVMEYDGDPPLVLGKNGRPLRYTVFRVEHPDSVDPFKIQQMLASCAGGIPSPEAIELLRQLEEHYARQIDEWETSQLTPDEQKLYDFVIRDAERKATAAFDAQRETLGAYLDRELAAGTYGIPNTPSSDGEQAQAVEPITDPIRRATQVATLLDERRRGMIERASWAAQQAAYGDIRQRRTALRERDPEAALAMYKSIDLPAPPIPRSWRDQLASGNTSRDSARQIRAIWWHFRELIHEASQFESLAGRPPIDRYGDLTADEQIQEIDRHITAMGRDLDTDFDAGGKTWERHSAAETARTLEAVAPFSGPARLTLNTVEFARRGATAVLQMNPKTSEIMNIVVPALTQRMEDEVADAEKEAQRIANRGPWPEYSIWASVAGNFPAGGVGGPVSAAYSPYARQAKGTEENALAKALGMPSLRRPPMVGVGHEEGLQVNTGPSEDRQATGRSTMLQYTVFQHSTQLKKPEAVWDNNVVLFASGTRERAAVEYVEKNADRHTPATKVKTDGSLTNPRRMFKPAAEYQGGRPRWVNPITGRPASRLPRMPGMVGGKPHNLLAKAAWYAGGKFVMSKFDGTHVWVKAIKNAPVDEGREGAKSEVDALSDRMPGPADEDEKRQPGITPWKEPPEPGEAGRVRKETKKSKTETMPAEPVRVVLNDQGPRGPHTVPRSSILARSGSRVLRAFPFPEPNPQNGPRPMTTDAEIAAMELNEAGYPTIPTPQRPPGYLKDHIAAGVSWAKKKATGLPLGAKSIPEQKELRRRAEVATVVVSGVMQTAAPPESDKYIVDKVPRRTTSVRVDSVPSSHPAQAQPAAALLPDAHYQGQLESRRPVEPPANPALNLAGSDATPAGGTARRTTRVQVPPVDQPWKKRNRNAGALGDPDGGAVPKDRSRENGPRTTPGRDAGPM